MKAGDKATKRRKVTDNDFYRVNNLGEIKASDSDVTGIITYIHERSPVSSNSELTNYLKSTLIVFECVSPDHYHTAVDLVKKHSGNPKD